MLNTWVVHVFEYSTVRESVDVPCIFWVREYCNATTDDALLMTDWLIALITWVCLSSTYTEYVSTKYDLCVQYWVREYWVREYCDKIYVPNTWVVHVFEYIVPYVCTKYVSTEYVSTATRYMCWTRELFTYSNIVPYVSLLMYHVYSEYVSTVMRPQMTRYWWQTG